MTDWNEGIEDALTYIEMHLTEELEIREIAKRTYVSPLYFQRIFAALCGAWE
jgi:AraC family transcriptional regulator